MVFLKTSKQTQGQYFKNIVRIPTIYCPVYYSLSPRVYQDFLTIESSRSHSDTSHSVGLLWKNDQPVAGTSTWQHIEFTREAAICQASFVPANPAIKRPQTHFLDRPATGIDISTPLSLRQWQSFQTCHNETHKFSWAWTKNTLMTVLLTL